MARTRQTARKISPVKFVDPIEAILRKHPFFQDIDLGLKVNSPTNSLTEQIILPKDIYCLIILNACYLTNILDQKKWINSISTVCKHFRDFMSEPSFKSVLQAKVFNMAHVLRTSAESDLLHEEDYQVYGRTDVALASWDPEGKWKGMYCNPKEDAFLSFSYASSIWQDMCSTFVRLEKDLKPFIDITISSNMSTHSPYPVDLFFIQKVPFQLKEKDQITLASHDDDWNPWQDHLGEMREILGIARYEVDDSERDDAEPPRKKVKRHTNTTTFFSPSSLPDFSKLFFINFFSLAFNEYGWQSNISDGFSNTTAFKSNQATKEMFEQLKSIFDVHFPNKNYYYEAYNIASEWIGWSMFIGELDRFYIVVSCFGERDS